MWCRKVSGAGGRNGEAGGELMGDVCGAMKERNLVAGGERVFGTPGSLTRPPIRAYRAAGESRSPAELEHPSGCTGGTVRCTAVVCGLNDGFVFSDWFLFYEHPFSALYGWSAGPDLCFVTSVTLLDFMLSVGSAKLGFGLCLAAGLDKHCWCGFMSSQLPEGFSEGHGAPQRSSASCSEVFLSS